MCEKLIDTVRHVFIETDSLDFEYFTHGGTVTLVEYKGKIYGLTCKHLVNIDSTVAYKDFCILNQRNGGTISGIENIAFPKNLKGLAVESDIQDMCIIEFSDNCTLSFFNNTPYKITDIDAVADTKDDKIYAVGALKELCGVNYETKKIVSKYICLPILAKGNYCGDSLLYKAEGKIPDDWEKIKKVTGLSGGAIYNASKNNKLSGVIMRAGVKGRNATFFYIGISPFLKALEALHNASLQVKYTAI